MKKGYGIFGKAYEIMLQNDLHDKHAIDYNLLRNMILLDKKLEAFLYQKPQQTLDRITFHELYETIILNPFSTLLSYL